MKKMLRRLLHNIKVLLYRLFCSVITKVYAVDNKKVVFSSFLGGSYSDNPRAISEKLHEIAPNYKIVWFFKDPNSKENIVPSYVTTVKYGSLSALYHQTTAGFWVDNYCKSFNDRKREEQCYIQTWHGDRGLKKVLADMYENPDDYKSYEREHCDLALAGSSFGEKVYHSSFKYDGQIMKKGCPRNDLLVNGDEEAVRAFRMNYKVADDTKLLLYAPTFRDANKSNVQTLCDLDMSVVLSELKQRTGEHWALMVRGHTGRKIKFQNTGIDEIIDVTDFEDTKYILLAADAVISDYSTVSTDFALLGRPIFLFVSDIAEYESNSRALWFRMNETPFWYAETETQLIGLIRNFTYDRAKQNCKEILDFYKTYESGESSEEVCRYIINYF